MYYKKLMIYTDGGARGNPGPAAIGVIIKAEDGRVLKKIALSIGRATNNQAEYKAVIAGLEKAKEFGAKELIVFLDSELVVKQFNRQYKVKDPDLALLFLKIYNLTVGYKKVSFKYLARQDNRGADELVNQALDKEGK